MSVPVVKGGPGDLHEFARLGDVAILDLLRLDERVHVHRVSRAKKATSFQDVALLAGLAQLLTQLGHLRQLLAGQAIRAAPRVQISLLRPRSHRRLGQIQLRATLPAVLPGWRTSSTTSALNSGVNDLRGRGFFFAIVSILDILSGGHPPLGGCPSNRVRPTLRSDRVMLSRPSNANTTPSDSLSTTCPFPGSPVIDRLTPVPRRDGAE